MEIKGLKYRGDSKVLKAAGDGYTFSGILLLYRSSSAPFILFVLRCLECDIQSIIMVLCSEPGRFGITEAGGS